MGAPGGQAPAILPDVMTEERYFYDGATDLDTPPVYGSVTRLDKLKDWSAAAGTVWQTVSQSTYDTTGRPATATDVKGNTTTTAYTPAVGGPLTKVTTTGPAPFNWSTITEVNPYWGSAVKSIDPNGKITSETEYDTLGRVLRVWTLGWSRSDWPVSPSVEYIYSTAPNRDRYPYTITKTLHAKGGYVTTFQILDGFYRPRQVQGISLNGDGSRLVTDTIYDSLGRAVSSYRTHAEPGAPSGTLWWEPDWSLPAVTRTVYDQNDAAGHTTALRQHTTAAGVGGAYDEAQYFFNRKGQLWKTTDAAGNEWRYTYDAKGRQTEAKDPDKGTTTSEYNDFDELIKTTDARGEALFYVYDQIGRKKELRDDSATGALRAEWKYDTLYSGQTGVRGLLTQAIRYEPAGSANAYKWQIRQVDGRYNPTGINTVIPAVETGLDGTYITGYGYSAYTGAPTSITYFGAADLTTETVTTDYDSITGLPVRLDTDRTMQTGTMLATWYTNYGEQSLTTRKMPGGIYVDDSVEYDTYTRRVNRTTIRPETATGTVSDRNYAYDPAGNITAIDENPQTGSADTQCFRYDYLNRLTSAWTPKAGVICDTNPIGADIGGPAAYWQEWTFNNTGSRLTETSRTAFGDTSRTYTVPTGGSGVVRPHAVTAMTITAPHQNPFTVNYQFDASGNTICRPNGSAANTCPTGTGSQVLAWNAEGKLATVAVGGTTTETNIYDAAGTRLIRRDATGTTLYLPGQEIRREGTVNKATRYYTFNGSVCASRNATGITWLYSDHQGTQQIAVQADTQTVSIRRQTPYGGGRGVQPPWPNNKGFVGGDPDPTGLINIGARQYANTLGTFISVDPVMDLGDPQQWNPYAYANNNPISKSDPSGLLPECGGGTGSYSCSNRVKKANGDGTFTGPDSSNYVATPAQTEKYRQEAEAKRKKRECEADFWCRNAGAVGMVAGIAAGVVAGGICMAATGGTGSVGCAALGGFVGGLVGSMVTNSLDADEESFGQFVGEALLGGAVGAVMGAGMALVGAAAFGAGVALTAGMGVRAATQMAMGGMRSALTSSAGAGTGSGIQGVTRNQATQLSKLLRSQLGDDVEVAAHGSRVSGTARSTSDLDIAIRVGSEQFDNILGLRFPQVNLGSARERTLLHSIATGKIQAGEAGLRGLRKSASELLGGMDVDISYIRIGGPFDNGPWRSL